MAKRKKTTEAGVNRLIRDTAKHLQNLAKHRLTTRENRADFLINWFLKVFDGRKAPFPARSFRLVANLMREHMKGSDYQTNH